MCHLPAKQHADDPAACEQHDTQQQDTQIDVPVIGQIPEDVLKRYKNNGADNRAIESANAAEMMKMMISPDICQENMVGLTKRLRSAKRAPARPVIAPENHEGNQRSASGRDQRFRPAPAPGVPH
jgi:hypothetical protein